MGIAIRTGHHCTQPIMERFNIPGTARISLAIYNTIEEIDICIASIKKQNKCCLRYANDKGNTRRNIRRFRHV